MPPTLLMDSLYGVRRRVKTLSVIFGVGIVVACAAATLLTAVFLDWCFDLPPVPRLLFLGCGVGVIGWAAYQWIIRPALARLSLGEIAGRLEGAFPEFSDRLRSTVNFVNGDVPGSAAMKNRVITEATQMAQRVDLSSALVVRPVIYSAGGAIAAILVVVMLAVLLGSEYVLPAFHRLINPFDDQPWPKRVKIDPAAIPSRIPVGSKINLSMRLTKGDKPSAHALVSYQSDDGPVQLLNMTRQPDGSYTASLDARGTSLKVSMKSGDDETKPVAITVVPRLAIGSVALMVTPPKYAKMDAFKVDLSSKPAMITFGSDVALRIAFNKPLDADKPVTLESLSKDEPLPKMQWNRGEAHLPIAAWNARQSVRFRIHATDVDGFENTALEEFEILVQPDQMPRVAIEKPTDRLAVSPQATVRLQIRAEDDFDIQSMKLIANRTARSDKSTTQPATDHWEIPLANWQRLDRTDEFQPFRLNYAWELSDLKDAKLQPGDAMEYYVQVRDNFDLDGVTHPPVDSRRLELQVVSPKDIENNAINALRQIGEEVQQAQNTQRNIREATKQLQDDTKNKPAMDKADKEVAEQRIGDQSTLASQTRSIAQRVDQIHQNLEDNKTPDQELKDLAADVKDNLQRAAEQPMQQATDKIAQASRSPQQNQADRNQSLADAQANQQAASDQLQQAMERMKNIGSLSKAIESIRKLLEDQQRVSADSVKIGHDNLGKTPQEMDKESQEKLQKNSNEQTELAQRTQKAAEDLQKTADQLSHSDKDTADAMKQAAETSQSQQVPQKQQNASQQLQQNQQADAQNNQKQAELGLQMMLDTLREAERRKLETLNKQLDTVIQAVANLVRQQAGHNIDNLLVQGAAKAKLLTDALLAAAERVRDHLPPPPTAPEQTGLQEQTARNTTDVLKQVSDLTGAAEAAASLNRASVKMGYAIVNLRDGKLPDAYDPHQAEALSSLQAALARLQEQKQQVQQKLDQQRKEQIREAYIKVRQEQAKINDRTTRIETARQPDGTLKHADRIDLGQLPGEQGKLAARLKELEEDLAGISIVYQWANKDIVSSMNEVKDDLAKPLTGIATQAEQKRVVEQLQAMIDNLAIKPPEPPKFAQKENGGGGGGSGQPKAKLPTEAELRLLKDLQVAINKSTRTINAAGHPKDNKEKLVALGNRQGEFRGLLDQLLKKGGGAGLPKPPDKADMLPEEAGKEQMEDDELAKNLLEDKPAEDKATKDIGLVGDRMARSQQRLAEKYDPGITTQKIQERIVKNMDDLIEEARQQQQQMASGSQPGQPKQGPPKPDQGNAQANNQGQKQGTSQLNHAQKPAANDRASAGNENGADLSKQLKETADNWGAISPRLHDAVIEGANEKVPDKYRSLVEDYYRSLATKATEKQ
jgi:hypothetical protein